MKRTKNPSKLTVNAQTLRVLDTKDAASVRGGGLQPTTNQPTTTVQPTHQVACFPTLH